MPIYSYQCVSCSNEFDEYFESFDGSGKTICPNCGNKAFKIPAIFNANIFKKRKFADGTETPDFVNTPKQEKDWLKATGTTYDAPVKKKKEVIKERFEKKYVKDGVYGTEIEHAFSKAVKKVEQGYKEENISHKHNIKGKVKCL